MTDFNEDNRKIDEALLKNKQQIFYQKLLHVTTTDLAPQLDLDVSNIDFTQYAEVKLYCSVPLAGASVTLRLNDSTGSNYCRTYCSSMQSDNISAVSTDSLALWRAQPEMMPTVNLSFHAPVSGSPVICDFRYVMLNEVRYEYDSFISAAQNVTWNTLQKLNFTCKNYYSVAQDIPVGTEVILYGLRK